MTPHLKGNAVKKRFLLALLLVGFAAAQNETRDVIDDAGSEIEIPVDPQRVAVAGERVLTEMAVAFGVAPTAAAATDEFAPFLLEAIGGADIQPLGSASEINLEALAAADPDLILLDVREEGDAVLEAARQIAPTVQLESFGVTPYTLIDTFGELFGAETGAALRARLGERIEEVRASVGTPEATEVSVGQLEPGGFRLILDTMLGATLINDIGFARPEGQGEAARSEADDLGLIRNLSLEELPRVEGDVLFFQTYNNQEDLESVTTSPLWESLDVVQRDAVQLVNYQAWNLGGVLAAEVVLDDIMAGLEQAGLVETSSE